MKKEHVFENDHFQFPIPKNKNVGRFLEDCSSVGSIESPHKKKLLPSEKNSNHIYGYHK